MSISLDSFFDDFRLLLKFYDTKRKWSDKTHSSHWRELQLQKLLCFVFRPSSDINKKISSIKLKNSTCDYCMIDSLGDFLREFWSLTAPPWLLMASFKVVNLKGWKFLTNLRIIQDHFRNTSDYDDGPCSDSDNLPLYVKDCN